jgi:hypothetical protein
MNPVETYLKELRDIRQSGAGVDETSYYTPLANLLNEAGKQLKPRVRCIMNLRNQGPGMPDGGLFTPEQFPKGSHGSPLQGATPSRGVIEAKSTKDDAWLTADSEQVTRYWTKYRQVLVTNYRDFVLVGRDSEGKPTKLETFRFAQNESEFWMLAANPKKAADQHGERFVEYLKRVMLYAAPLSSPKDLAWFLASYARDAKSRIEQAELPALTSVRNALEEGLGLKFEGLKGEHFFRSSLVQTLFYGIFSAWVLWSKQHPRSNRKVLFNWRLAAQYLRVPILRKLFYEIAEPGQLDTLKLSEVLEWTGTALNRVDRNSFFAEFEERHAVQYFYEPFLEAFDPELRKELGVWFTPTEIVQYMVARVDTVLKEELDTPDGLADPRVYVLDPCCGTGAYLVEVLKRINKTLDEKGTDALHGDDLKRAAMERVFGFEILPAPFVVAHLQLGLLLQNLGAPFSETDHERAGVFLTNALTGWEPPKEPKTHLGFPEMEEERDAAEEVKREKPILVILGNPPYNAFAGVSPAEEQGLVQPYKEGLISEWGIKKFNLDDLYIRFFRLAERRIAEKTGQGVVAFISNHSWVSEPSFVVLRKHLLESFDRFWVENMHGNRKISEYAPDGRTSETIFAIPGFSAGIQQGVAISLWVKGGTRKKGPQVFFRDDLNAASAVKRRAQLLESIGTKRFNSKYEAAKPDKSNRFSFKPSEVIAEYMRWPRIVELSAIPPSNGLMEKRGGVLMDYERNELEKRMKAYLNEKLSWDEYKALGYGLTQKQARFDPRKARAKVMSVEKFSQDRLLHYALRPFDTRWCYYTGVRPIWNEPRPTLWAQHWKGNRFLMTRPAGVASPEGVPFYFTSMLGDNDFLRGHAYYFPLFTKHRSQANNKIHLNQLLVFEEAAEYKTGPSANLSQQARTFLSGLKLPDPDRDNSSAELIWMHALAIGYAPLYLKENADGVRQDWPRIPLPNSKKLLLASADLGKQIASLLDTENNVSGVTSGAIRPEMKSIAIVSRVGGGRLNPDSGDLTLTVGWGHEGKEGVTMPGKGKLVQRGYTKDEEQLIAQGAKALHLTQKEAYTRLGETTYDVFLNDRAYWKNIPANVWDYTIGGYQVIKKWLSYREQELLSRSLTNEEAREVMSMARRIAAIILLEPTLNENYLAVKDTTYAWPPTES